MTYISSSEVKKKKRKKKEKRKNIHEWRIFFLFLLYTNYCSINGLFHMLFARFIEKHETLKVNYTLSIYFSFFLIYFAHHDKKKKKKKKKKSEFCCTMLKMKFYPGFYNVKIFGGNSLAFRRSLKLSTS